jgi:hypothetical protein
MGRVIWRADAFFTPSLSERLLAAINAGMPSPTATLPNPSESNLNKQGSTIPTFERTTPRLATGHCDVGVKGERYRNLSRDHTDPTITDFSSAAVNGSRAAHLPPNS